MATIGPGATPPPKRVPRRVASRSAWRASSRAAGIDRLVVTGSEIVRAERPNQVSLGV